MERALTGLKNNQQGIAVELAKQTYAVENQNPVPDPSKSVSKVEESSNSSANIENQIDMSRRYGLIFISYEQLQRHMTEGVFKFIYQLDRSLYV